MAGVFRVRRRFIRGKDGHFAGSAPTGHLSVPTAQEHPRSATTRSGFSPSYGYRTAYTRFKERWAATPSATLYDYDTVARHLSGVQEATVGARGPKAPPTFDETDWEYPEFASTYLNGDIRPSETKAILMAVTVHRGQTDHAGVPYIAHPCTVTALLVQSPEYAELSTTDQDFARQAAWLHDSLEDTVLTERDLRAAEFDDRVVDTVVALTSLRSEPRDTYYARVRAAGPVAVAVKLADIRHNSLPERRAALPGAPGNPVGDGEDDAFTRLGRKYCKAYVALGAEVPQHLRVFHSST